MSIKDYLCLDADPLFLIDGSALIYRAFYAFPNLARSDGFPTNALFILLRVLLKLLREEAPRYAVFVLDGKGPTFRHAFYPGYKAQREAMPEALLIQLPLIQEAVRLLGLRIEDSQGVEADDRIASLAIRFRGEVPIVIVSGDKDFKQCLHEQVVLFDPGTSPGKAGVRRSRGGELLTLKTFQAETDLAPAQWPDYQALVGDPSDNLPGVPGVGHKTALKLLARFPDLEAIALALVLDPTPLNLAEYKKLIGQMEPAFLWRELARLRIDQADEDRLEDFLCRPSDLLDLRAFLETYEFRSLLPDLHEASVICVATPVAPSAADVTILEDMSGLPDLAGQAIGLVIAPQGCCVATSDWEWCLPQFLTRMAQPHESSNGTAFLAAIVARAGRIYCPAVKELLRIDSAWAVVPMRLWADLGLAGYLLNPEERGYSMADLARRFGPSLSDMFHPTNVGRLALALGCELDRRIVAAGENLVRLHVALETPLIAVLAGMERTGIVINRAACASFLAEVRGQLAYLETHIQELAGISFNVRSNQQLSEVLYTKLGLKAMLATPSGTISTSKEALERLLGKHPILEAILEFRKLEKLRSTYLESLPRLVRLNGRLHTNFNQMATATGRLSSSNPNLQNIPIRGSLGRRMRACFTAEPGALLISAAIL